MSITDDELTALALAADPDDVEFDDDVRPFGVADDADGLLPAWYMPAAVAGPATATASGRRRRVWVVGGLVLAMLTVNGFGLCVTYGLPEVGDRLVSFW